jgi:hypothetical protein
VQSCGRERQVFKSLKLQPIRLEKGAAPVPIWSPATESAKILFQTGDARAGDPLNIRICRSGDASAKFPPVAPVSFFNPGTVCAAQPKTGADAARAGVTDERSFKDQFDDAMDSLPNDAAKDAADGGSTDNARKRPGHKEEYPDPPVSAAIFSALALTPPPASLGLPSDGDEPGAESSADASVESRTPAAVSLPEVDVEPLETAQPPVEPLPDSAQPNLKGDIAFALRLRDAAPEQAQRANALAPGQARPAPAPDRPIQGASIDAAPIKKTLITAARIDAASRETAQTEAKPVAAKPVETKPIEAHPIEVAPIDAAPIEVASMETAQIESKPVEAKPVEAKPIAAKPVEAKPIEAAPIDPASIETAQIEANPVGAKPIEAHPIEATPQASEAAPATAEFTTPDAPVARPAAGSSQNRGPGASPVRVAAPATASGPQNRAGSKSDPQASGESPRDQMPAPRPERQRAPEPKPLSDAPAVPAQAGGRPAEFAAQTVSPAAAVTPIHAGAPGPAPRAVTASVSEPAVAAPEATRGSSVSAVTDVSVTVPISRADSAGAERVAIRMVQRGAEIHVSVRTPDAQLSQALREDLGKLSNGLDQAGFRTETWRPAVTAAAQPPSSSANQDPSNTSSHRDGSNPDSLNGGRQGSAGGDCSRRQQEDRPRWVAELEQSRNS